MSDTRGIFSLRTVLKKKNLTQWVSLDDVWIDPATPNTGYFGGGAPGYSTMDKTTYSTDTTAEVPGAALSVARIKGLAATGSSTAGYFGGGFNVDSSSTVATMDKVTYSSDTTAAVPGAALSVARSFLAATGSSTAGYFGGGNPSYSTMDKTTYSTDTTAAVPGAALSAARRYLAATGNSTAGYFGGGYPYPGYSTMDKVTYSSDTTAAVPGAALSGARYQIAGATGNSTAGYFGGGRNTSGRISTMDKTTYSTDTTAEVPGAALSGVRDSAAATGNSDAGYFGGGNPGPLASMNKTTYSSDTTAALPSGANLSVARSQLAAASARANALPTLNTSAATRFSDNLTEFNRSGYFGGGQTPSAVATMDKTTYSSETTAEVPGAALSVARSGHGASSARANALPTTASTPAPVIV